MTGPDGSRPGRVSARRGGPTAVLFVVVAAGGCLLGPGPTGSPALVRPGASATRAAPTPAAPIPAAPTPAASTLTPSRQPTGPPASAQPIGFAKPEIRPAPAGYEPPAFRPSLEALREFYRLEWLPDGYPGRRADDGSIQPHPLYGVYVLSDYVAQHRVDHSERLQEAIEVVARAAIARMELFRGSLVFRYPGDRAVGRAVADHYSGLTQAYYAVALYQAYQQTADPFYRDAAELCFRSLLIAEEDGGVLYRWRNEVAIAEVPARPRDLVLNGWQSALVSVERYAHLSGSLAAMELFEASSATMARLLPLFDARPYRNSRYALAGPVAARLSITPAGDARLSEMVVHIPDDGTFEVPAASLSRWQTHLDPADVSEVDGLLRPRDGPIGMSLVLSRLSHPQPNELRFTLDTARSVEVELQLLVGRYDPLSASEVQRSWQTASARSVPAGRHRVHLPIEWRVADLIAYPTNFVKVLEGQQTNVYHPIHVMRLEALHASTGQPAFAEYAARWKTDICAWAGMAIYEGMSVRSYWTPGDSVVDPADLCEAG